MCSILLEQMTMDWQQKDYEEKKVRQTDMQGIFNYEALVDLRKAPIFRRLEKIGMSCDWNILYNNR